MTTPNTPDPLHLAVALDGAGWHPAAWREPDARPTELFTARYWTDLVAEAEAGLLDFVTIEDALALQSTRFEGTDTRTDQVRGRLDAVLIASRVAPLTEHIGLIPTATVTHTEPFHVSKAIATLDFVSLGRAGWRAQVSRPAENAHFGRREHVPFTVEDLDRPDVAAAVAESFAEAQDFVEVVRRLWDSWEDDAEIRDAATDRFIDRGKLHYIDFVGPRFRVRGPSIVPRPPQGQPLVTVLAHATLPYRLGARAADVVYVTPRDHDDARAIVTEIRAEQRAAGRESETVHVFADLVVLLDESTAAARDRKARLDALDGAEYAGDALVFTGTAADLADTLQDWQRAGLTGFRLRPAALPHDLHAVTRDLVPELQRRGAFRTGYEAGSLRARLGLPRPDSRYATPTAAAS
ncbi:LLM class flavin-dependent oxidoreductase [Embleya scabrispora]|uniref:LLM class flavin-dependent oxidoreductase n=1 Tax=Embleya scabrispora TaxID=159449 RepID=UPI000365196C|nr:LLM class flavin-dependent oxidoreductase [Embleya scabrispora]MYS85987.1 LLM class flavin-dependent oxidoreductase [Streptomyces sp. SID5474]